MLWITILVGALIAVAALAYVVMPMWRPPRPIISDDETALADLLYRKDALLMSIKELEFDYNTGKLSDADYQRFDQRLRQQTIGVIRQIERLSPDMTTLDSELEAAIAARRKVKDRGRAEVAPADPVTPATRATARFCHNCGAPVDAADRFCGQCGAQLRGQEVAEVA